MLGISRLIFIFIIIVSSQTYLFAEPSAGGGFTTNDCGPLVLMECLKIFQMRAIDLPLARSLCKTTARGTSMHDLERALTKSGLEVCSVLAKPESLLRENNLCIIPKLIVGESGDYEYHFVILANRIGESIEEWDTLTGWSRKPIKHISESWTGETLIIFPSNIRMLLYKIKYISIIQKLSLLLIVLILMIFAFVNRHKMSRFEYRIFSQKCLLHRNPE